MQTKPIYNATVIMRVNCAFYEPGARNLAPLIRIRWCRLQTWG